MTLKGSVTISADTFTLLAGGRITGVGSGFANNAGPGASTSNACGASHAGCGGCGSCNLLPTSTSYRVYDSIYAPTQMGSGGRDGSVAGGFGGGAFVLSVSGSLLLNGTVDVSAGNGVAGGTGCCNWGGGGGSGGSIMITAGTLLASYGSLVSNGGDGGNGYSSQWGTGGSGGRIALTCGAHAYPSSAWGSSGFGLGFSMGGGSSPALSTYAAPGTAWIDCGARNRTLLVDNRASLRTGLPAYVVESFVSHSVQEVRLTNGGTVTWSSAGVGSNSTVVSLGLLTGDSTGTLSLAAQVAGVFGSSSIALQGGAYEVNLPPATVTPLGYSLWQVQQQRTYFVDATQFSFGAASVTVSAQATLVTPANITVASNTLSVNGNFTGARSISIASGGTVSLLSGGNTPGFAGSRYDFDAFNVRSSGTLSVGSGVSVSVVNVTTFGTATVALNDLSFVGVSSMLTVDSGTTVRVIGRANVSVAANAYFIAGSVVSGTSSGFANNAGPGASTSNACGASHAGCGGCGSCNLLPTSTSYRVYDSIYAPTQMGSGGRDGSVAGGFGGGAFVLSVSGSLLLNGTVDVSAGNGVAGGTGCCNWGGGGGSGGSIMITAGTLLASYGSLVSNGGDGGNGYSSQWGTGGSGGRIALTCGAHAYPSSAWGSSGFGLGFSMGGGSSPALSTYAAPGTAWIDCGARNRTLLVDNRASLRTGLPAYVVESFVSHSVQEVRLTNGGTVTWSSAGVGSNTTTVSAATFSGDQTGVLTMAASTVLIATAWPAQIMPSAFEQSLPPISTSQLSLGSWAIQQQRVYYVDMSLWSFSGACHCNLSRYNVLLILSCLRCSNQRVSWNFPECK